MPCQNTIKPGSTHHKIFTELFLIYWSFEKGDQVSRKCIWGWLTLESEVNAHLSAMWAIHDLISWSLIQGVCDWQTWCKKSVLGLHKKNKKKHFLSYFGVCWLDVFLLSAVIISEETEWSSKMSVLWAVFLSDRDPEITGRSDLKMTKISFGKGNVSIIFLLLSSATKPKT